MKMFIKNLKHKYSDSICQSEILPQTELQRITGMEANYSEDCDASSKNEFPFKNNALLQQVDDTVKGYQFVLSVKGNDPCEFIGDLLAYEDSNIISCLKFHVFSNNNVYIENLHTKEEHRNKGIATTLIKLMHSILFQFCKNQKFFVNAIPFDCGNPAEWDTYRDWLERFYAKFGFFNCNSPSDAAQRDDDISEEIEKTLEKIREKLPIIK